MIYSSFIRADRFDNAALRQLILINQHQQKLTRQLRARLPTPLAKTLAHLHIRDGSLFLYCTAPAWAWQLRFEQEKIRRWARELDWPEFDTIKLKIMPDEIDVAHPIKPPDWPMTATIGQIDQASRLQPDPELRQALANLSATLARKANRATKTG